MKNARPDTDDPLIRGFRRSVARARALLAQRTPDYRLVLVMAAEMSEQMRNLNERVQMLEAEIKAVSHRVLAVNAYKRCASLGQRQTRTRRGGDQS